MFAQVVQVLRASSRPRPRVLDLRGRPGWAVGLQRSLLRSTSAKAQTVLGLDETSAAPTSSARVSHAMADTIDTSSAAVQGRGCMEIGINTTSSGGTCIHSVRILGPYARCTAKKSRSSELLSSVSLNLVYYGFLWTLIGARTSPRA